MELTYSQKKVIQSILLPDHVRADRRGRPWSDRREIVDRVLWILRTGAPWQDLPPRYGAYRTVNLRFQSSVRSATIEKLLLRWAKHLKGAGGVDLKECFVNGTFVPAQKGAPGRQDQTRQKHQDHGHCRWPWSSCRPADRRRLAC